MQLQTKNFGDIIVEDNDIIYFSEGIPGFEDLKRYTLVGRQELDVMFFWLQCIDEPSLAFVVTDPFLINQEYYVDVDDSEIEELDIQDTQAVLTLAIVTVPEDVKKTSVNLKAPLLINLQNNKGKQIVMKNETFPVKYYIMKE